jgi:hypothetical protein
VSMTSAKGGRTERLQIMVDGDELAMIDDFRFRSRMPSRAAAVRELLRRGLASRGARVTTSLRKFATASIT